MRKLCTLSLLFLNDDGAVRCGGDARFVHGFGRANSSALFVRHFYGVCSDLGGRLRRTRLIPSSLVNIHTPACRRVAKCANFNVLIVFRFGKKLPLTIQVWCNQFTYSAAFFGKQKFHNLCRTYVEESRRSGAVRGVRGDLRLYD